jgi:hypothetical protein
MITDPCRERSSDRSVTAGSVSNLHASESPNAARRAMVSATPHGSKLERLPPIAGLDAPSGGGSSSSRAVSISPVWRSCLIALGVEDYP